MARSINRVILLGHIGSEPEIKHTASGAPVAQFSVATNRRWKDKTTGLLREETDWHRVVLWQPENVKSFLRKGALVAVEGRLQTRSWDDKNGITRYVTEIIAESLSFCGGPAGSGDKQAKPPAEAAAVEPERAQANENKPFEATDDDVPF